MAGSVWADNIDHELRHWYSVLKALADGPAAGRVPRVANAGWLRSYVSPPSKPPETFRVLDVGAGPISVYGVPASDSGVTIVAVDALGDKYNELFDKFNLDLFPRIICLKAEDLTKFFAVNSFDLVSCSNSLDHCENPENALKEMIAVCRPGGCVKVLSVENEGERQNYTGLHKWNLTADSDGLWLWNPEVRKNLSTSAAAEASFVWRYVDHGQTGFKIIEVLFHLPR